MAFYSPDASMDQRLAALVQRLAGERGQGLSDGLSITWLRYGRSLLELDRDRQDSGDAGTDAAVHGAAWQGARLRDPADLVQLVYLIASERWLQRGLLEEEPELRRAQQAMIRLGSHDATSYVVDRLSGTTSGPALSETNRQAWMDQRQLVDAWLMSLGWPELEGCRAAHKTWQDGPYGREHDFLTAAQLNGNRFSSDGLARLLQAVLAGSLISPPACQRMRQLLAVPGRQETATVEPGRALDALVPSPGAGWRRFWGRAGRGPASHQLALYGEGEGRDSVLLVVLAEPAVVGGAEGLLPGIVDDLFSAACG